MSNIVLVVVAHADDEVLGCGGVIARHIANGDSVHVLYMADGVGARGGELEVEIMCRGRARDEALRILGVTQWCALDFPDNRMDGLPLLDIVQPLERIISAIGPAIVYTHHWGDLNVDHRLTHQAVMTACRPLPGSSVRQILTFEVMSSTEWSSFGETSFAPNFYVDIKAHLELKCRALMAYDLEMRPAPHSRSIEHITSLARHRGYSVGLEAAEAFFLVRNIIGPYETSEQVL
ncbi:MAG: PIG-L family deacetylase [Castellaniella sp.]|nr:PIG-L family deacetylase [Castellaniella sp.]